MNEMNPDLISEKDSQTIFEKYKKRTNTLALLNDLTRLRLILLLIVFRKLSLTQLSVLLGRVKSTTSHHLKKLSDIIKISTKKEIGKTDSNIYELVPNFLEKLSVNIDTFPAAKNREYPKLIPVKWHKKTFKSNGKTQINFYDNLFDVILRNKEMVVTPEHSREVVRVINFAKNNTIFNPLIIKQV